MQVELCRLCLCKENLKPLFSGLQKSNNYSVILMLTTGLQIDEDDGFPQTICNSCSELVKSSFELRNTSRKSESKLKKLGYRKNKNYEEYRNEIKTEEKCGSEMDYIIKTESLIEEKIIKCENSLEFNRLTNPIDEDQIEDDSKTSLHQDDDDDSHTPLRRDDDAEVHDSTVKSEAATGSEYVLTKNGNIKTLSRKEKRAVYMNLVEGEFDPKGPIKCKVCKKTVSKWASFMTHSKLHLGFKFVCEYCGKSFISSTQLNRHCRSYHGMSRELACRHCDYLALDNTQLVLHERRVHTGERPFICDLCGTSYFSRRCLIQHIENHSTVKTIQCEKCPQMFKSRRHLARHTYTTHTSKQYSYKCPICAHIYRNLKYIRVHLKKLHGLTTKDAKIVKIKL